MFIEARSRTVSIGDWCDDRSARVSILLGACCIAHSSSNHSIIFSPRSAPTFTSPSQRNILSLSLCRPVSSSRRSRLLCEGTFSSSRFVPFRSFKDLHGITKLSVPPCLLSTDCIAPIHMAFWHPPTPDSLPVAKTCPPRPRGLTGYHYPDTAEKLQTEACGTRSIDPPTQNAGFDHRLL